MVVGTIFFKEVQNTLEPGDTVIIVNEDGKGNYKTVFNEWIPCKYMDNSSYSYSCSNCNGYISITNCKTGKTYNECIGYTSSKLSSVEKIIKSNNIKPLEDSMFKI